MACHQAGTNPFSEPMLGWALGNNNQWDINRKWHIFIQENPIENVVWKMAAIVPSPLCANETAIDVRAWMSTSLFDMYMHVITMIWSQCALQWRHNEGDGVSNHRRLNCLLSRL